MDLARGLGKPLFTPDVINAMGNSFFYLCFSFDLGVLFVLLCFIKQNLAMRPG